MNLEPNALILDLGCGSGRDLRYFSSLDYNVVGLDYSFNLCELARQFSEQPVVFGDFTSIPFENNTFDAVWSIGSLLHIPRCLLRPSLSEIHRVLKPNSILITSIKEGCGETTDSLGRYFAFYSRSEWQDILEESGYGVLELEDMVEERRLAPDNRIRIKWIVCVARACVKQESLGLSEAIAAPCSE